MTLLLGGYFGCSNLGDELIVQAFRAACPVPSVVLRGLGRMPWSVLLQSLRRRDACLVFPGGEVFQDRTSLASLLFYAGQVLAARLAGRRVFLLFQGWPEDLSPWGQRVAHWVFGQADFVSFRDRRSVPAGLARRALRRQAMFSSDPVFLFRRHRPRRRTGLLCVLGRPKDRAEFRAWPEVLRRVGEVLRPERIVFASFHPGDRLWAKAAAETTGGTYEDFSVLAPGSAVERFGAFRFALCGRYHAAVLAALHGMGWLGLDRDGRLTGFGRYLGGRPVVSWTEVLRHPGLVEDGVRQALRMRSVSADVETLRREVRAVLRRFRRVLEEDA